MYQGVCGDLLREAVIVTGCCWLLFA
ncbi:Protein of unknown function [Pyronema omphalodes CBS 100304]|uniref:Uncharacterized protein n=1 Tax=Pyronema omphalodes (strain CBS 100304) TaxID=1076935 RepID=U4LSZ2_PYROM|nr:Protein of unknown function [Pyronema omphalodes CBS 100304]